MQPYIPTAPITLTLSGYNYTRPAHLGAGRRKRLNALKTTAVQSLPEFKERYSKIDFDNSDSASNDYAKLLTEFNMNYPEEGECAQLEAILTPCEGSPSVREWYMEIAEPEEAQEQLDFLSGNANSKTATSKASSVSSDTNTPNSGVSQ